MRSMIFARLLRQEKLFSNLVFAGFLLILALSGITTPVLTDFSPLKHFDSIEKVTPVEKTAKTEVATVNRTRAARSNSVTTTRSASTAIARTASAQTVSGDRISIAGRTVPIFVSSNTSIDAGSKVGLFRKLLYGHNSSAVFGILANVSAGSTFTVTMNGATTTYRISQKITVEKTSLMANNRMNYLVNSASYTAPGISTGSHDVVLMTCAGTLYGNGDASHRTLIFADRV